MRWVYLDNNATTQPAPAVINAMREVNETLWANPSSVHRFGQVVRQRMELARQSVATLVGAKPRDLVFTSGGTEANNLAIAGLLSREAGGALVTTPVEHSAVREPAAAYEAAGGIVRRIAVDTQGLVSVESLREHLAELTREPRTVLVSVQWANNETGAIQPVEQVVRIVEETRESAKRAGVRSAVLLHVDATQAVGKLPVDVAATRVDLLTLAAHKFHGPKGVGALYVRSGVRLRPVQRGGPQERDRRGGTENTAGVIGMGVAADLAAEFVRDDGAVGTLRALRDRFERGVRDAVPNVVVNSGDPGTPRLWNTTNLAFPGLEAEAILLGLSERGVCASAGAACSSGSLEPSPVLLAMGIPEPVAHGSVRFSLGRFTTAAEIDEALATVPQVVARLGQTMPMGV